ncbi:MAG: hypothetical protein IJ008_04810 [Clostridia bacterium]|nr:hypothetical protein [Clostridia bacterium]
MVRKDYEKLIREKFKGNTKKIMLEQVKNFYEISKKDVYRKKYKVGENVYLAQYNLIAGLNLNIEYLKQISKEGKICADYTGIETNHKVKWAVSTWKFAKRIKLKDYITNYSGMTIAYNDTYEIVPYEKIKTFVKKLKKQYNFLWEAESTREMRFLPSNIIDNDNIGLIFNMGHEGCEKMLKNELTQNFIPDEIKLTLAPNEQNNLRYIIEKSVIERCSYVIFGIPRNCIEGLFVNRKTESNKELLSNLKELFPDCYICNLDGKVIVE